jgi:hypothetical protein
MHLAIGVIKDKHGYAVIRAAMLFSVSGYR